MNYRIPVMNVMSIFLLLFFSGCGDEASTQTGTTSSVTLTADKTQVMASFTDGVTLTATVRDSNGSPITNQVVQFNGPYGNYNYQIRDHTDVNGSAILILSHFPVDPSWSDVLPLTATSGGVTSNEVVISFSNPQNPATVTLEADKTSVTADGTNAVKFTATVKDRSGILLVYQHVTWNVPSGPFIKGVSSGTNYAGQAFMTLRRQPTGLIGSQPVSVTATCGGITSNAVTATFTQPG